MNTGTRLVRVLILDDDKLTIKNPKVEKMRIRLDEAMDLDKAWGILEDIALENRSASLDLREYTLYNPAGQFIRWADLLLNHNGDADAMCRWMRANAPDDALTYNYGYAVFLKREIEKDPTLIDRIRLAAFDIVPGLEEAIKRKATKRSKR